MGHLVNDTTTHHWSSLLVPVQLQVMESVLPENAHVVDSFGHSENITSDSFPYPSPSPGPKSAAPLILPPLPASLIVDSSFPTRALKIRQPWIGYVLRGVKTWEISGLPCPHRGLVALFQVGAMRIVGTARIVESKMLTDVDMEHGFRFHHIHDWENNVFIKKYKSQRGMYAWILEDVRSVDPIDADFGCGVQWGIMDRCFALPRVPVVIDDVAVVDAMDSIGDVQNANAENATGRKTDTTGRKV